MTMTKERSLVPITPNTRPVRRVVGQAIHTNPLIGAVACVTRESVIDIEEEIQLAENYLAGLKAMHAVATVALGMSSSGEAEPVAEPEVSVTQTTEPPKPTVTPMPAKNQYAKTGVMATVRAIIAEHPDWTAPEVTAEAKRRGCESSDAVIKQAVYTLRAKTKKAKLVDRDEEDVAVEENVAAASSTLPPRESPHYPAAELTLRKTIAEFIFKKGLVGADDLVKNCGIDAKGVKAFMSHAWFELHNEKWRLTTVGKNEGLDW